MALSDPVNVRLGAERRKKQLAKLAQQMAAKAGGRVQGAARNVRGAVDLRSMAVPGMQLPFALPQNRARPAGFQPSIFDSQLTQSAQAAQSTINPVTGAQYTFMGDNPSGGGYGGGMPLPSEQQGDLSLDQPMASAVSQNYGAPDPWMFAIQMAMANRTNPGTGSRMNYAV